MRKILIIEDLESDFRLIERQLRLTKAQVQCRVSSRLVEFRIPGPQHAPGELKMVSILDVLNDGLSAVYTFYDTSLPSASFGTYNILWLSDWTKQLGLPYLYLGYWIEESQKMTYKQNFRPQEALIAGTWQPL